MTYIELIGAKNQPYDDNSFHIEESYDDVCARIRRRGVDFIELTPVKNTYNPKPKKITVNVKSIKKVTP